MPRRAPWLAAAAIAAAAIVGWLGCPRARSVSLMRVGYCAFDFPVGVPDAHGYYDAQPFGTAAHLGSDWNGNGGADTDLGDPVHAIADGVVVEADDLGGGWGNVVRIEHGCGLLRVEAIYAHLDAIEVAAGARVTKGQRIGTIGTAAGQYLAHLHLELRTAVRRPIGEGYGDPVGGQIDPTAFITAHR